MKLNGAREEKETHPIVYKTAREINYWIDLSRLGILNNIPLLFRHLSFVLIWGRIIVVQMWRQISFYMPII